MPAVNEFEAIAIFADAFNPFVKSLPSTAREVVEAFARFCREVQIIDADDGVMLELCTGRPHHIDAFTDIRGGSSVDWDEISYQCLGLTRQISATNEDDDTALCVNLYFGETRGGEPAKVIEFFSMQELDARLAQFSQDETVAKLLSQAPTRVTAFACEAG